MVEYYKLTLLKKTKKGDMYEENIYLEINGDKSEVIAHTSLPERLALSVVLSKLERITEELAEKVLQDLYGKK